MPHLPGGVVAGGNGIPTSRAGSLRDLPQNIKPQTLRLFANFCNKLAYSKPIYFMCYSYEIARACFILYLVNLNF